MRFEDSPDLFGVGIGSGTYGDIKCYLCGALHNEGEDKRGIYDGDSCRVTDFAGMEICECCFEIIEKEILHRMDDILSWYRRILDAKKCKIDQSINLLEAVEKETIDDPWPFRDMLTKLCDAADILLIDKSYDGHGYEEIQICVEKGRALIREGE